LAAPSSIFNVRNKARRSSLASVYCEMLNGVKGADEARSRSDVQLAFTALANGQLAE
jgi:hypothetical protein